MKVGRIKQSPKPLVVVEIHDGVTETTTYGEVDVLQIDWDMFDGGWDDAEIGEYLDYLDKTLGPLLERIPEPRQSEIQAALAEQRKGLE